MASSGFDHAAWDKTIPTDAPEVARIMRDRGVGRRRATHLAKQAKAESIDVSGVSLSQKEQVLAAIIDGAKTSNDLIKDLPKVDGHDVVKLLWACQKSGWITFRERKSGGYGKHGDRPKIFAIKVTDEGYLAMGRKAVSDITDKRAEAEPPEEKTVDLGPAEDDAPAVVEAGIVVGGTFRAWDGPTLGVLPLIDALLQRADKAQRLESAARILEQAGEDDLALQVMGKTEFTALEREVVLLARHIFREET